MGTFVAPPRLVCLIAAVLLTCACGDDTTQPTDCKYSVTPVELAPCMAASQLTATISTQTGCAWTASAGASWMTVVAGASGSGPGTITLGVSSNYDAPRIGLMVVSGSSRITYNVKVSQAGCTYSVTQASFNFGAAGGSTSFDVYQMADPNTCGGPLQNACMWSAVADATWITISGSMPRSGDDRVAFTVAANTTGASRTGTITVRNKVVQITQAG
jgi:hypothetical protein